jgi:hypothetical protein
MTGVGRHAAQTCPGPRYDYRVPIHAGVTFGRHTDQVWAACAARGPAIGN